MPIPGLSEDIGGDRLAPVWLPDIFENIVLGPVSDSLGFSVKFDAGHYQDVAQNLTYDGMGNDMGDIPPSDYWPLFWLIMDTDEVSGGNLNDKQSDLDLNIIIAMPTNPEWTMKTRRDKTFMPYLIPIYNEFMYQVSRSVMFGQPNIMQIRHIKTNRPFWGGKDANGNTTTNLFNHNVDAVQIRNLKLKLERQNCHNI